MPHISDLNCHEGATPSLSLLMCLSICTLFPSNKHFTCSPHLSTISLWKFIFFKAKELGALSLVTVPGSLEVRVQYSQSDFSLWKETKILLQATANWEISNGRVLVAQHGTLRTPPFGCPWRLHHIDMIDSLPDHWWLVQHFTPFPSWKSGSRRKLPTLYPQLVPLATSPQPQVLSKSQLHDINPVVVERGLLWTFISPLWL